MRVKCEYCNNFIDDTEEQCPYCGAPNEHMARSAAGIPKTIEELRAFAIGHNLPLEKMRFFIGEDYKGAKAFGIYKKPDGNVVVYKNKADGSRAVRYEGTDEAYAVNELYQKMKSEVASRKANLPRSRVQNASGEKPRKGFGCSRIILILFLFFVVLAIIFAITDNSPRKGYYSYNGQNYYYDDDWYIYYGTGWYPAATVAEELSTNSDDYYDSEYYSYTYGTTDFEDSGWSSDWDDDDWDWDNDWDWDTGDTDWDDDW